jgi:hypothetical protein
VVTQVPHLQGAPGVGGAIRVTLGNPPADILQKMQVKLKLGCMHVGQALDACCSPRGMQDAVTLCPLGN